MKITIVGMGLIGGSLYKAAVKAGYEAEGLDKDSPVRIEDTDVLLLALPPDVLVEWFKCYAHLLGPGAVVVDTCGVKTPVCKAMQPLVPSHCTFVGGHPMAGREISGFAYSDASLFHGASMILTPYPDTDKDIMHH